MRSAYNSRPSNFRKARHSGRRPHWDLCQDGFVFVRSTDPKQDQSAFSAIEPRLERLRLHAPTMLVEALHGDIFDEAVQCTDPFAELSASLLTGPSASDLCVALTLVGYKDALAAAWDRGYTRLSPENVDALVSDARKECQADDFTLSQDAQGLSVLAQHTLYTLGSEARQTSEGAEMFIQVLRHLIAHGRLAAMLDPRES